MKIFLFLLVMNGAGQVGVLEYDEVFDNKIDCERELYNNLPEWKQSLAYDGLQITDHKCLSEEEIMDGLEQE